jgi:hypothetical protein
MAFIQPRISCIETPAMTKTLKTAPELERYILNELRTCSACNAVSAVTVSETTRPDSNWEVSHINVAGGVVPAVCAALCEDIAGRLRERFDLVIEIEPEEL